MMPRAFEWLCVLMLAGLAGCASVTFKPGASADAMAADERACRESTKSDAAYADCMRSRGSFVAGRGAAAETKAPAVAAKTPIVMPVAKPDAAPANEPPRSAPPAAPAPKVALDPPATPAAEPTATIDPLARIEVASWWKLGGNPAQLQTAIDACVAKLGDAHRPDPGATVVTTGLRSCLHDAGWYAFGK